MPPPEENMPEPDLIDLGFVPLWRAYLVTKLRPELLPPPPQPVQVVDSKESLIEPLPGEEPEEEEPGDDVEAIFIKELVEEPNEEITEEEEEGELP